MNKRDFCYGALNQILVMTDYLEDQKSNRAGFVKYQTIKGLKAIRCCRNPGVFFKYREKGKGKESFFFSSVARNSYLPNKPEAEGVLSLPLPPPLNLLYRYLKLHGTGERRSKDGFVVTNWEWNSGPSAQKAAYQPFLLSETLLHNFIIKYPQLTNKINGRYFR